MEIGWDMLENSDLNKRSRRRQGDSVTDFSYTEATKTTSLSMYRRHSLINFAVSYLYVVFVEWLMVSKVEKLILAVKSKETMAVLERWQFDIRNEKDDPSFTNNGASPSGSRASAPPKTEQQIQEEIQAIMRQITACVTFLPMLDSKCKEEPRYSFHYRGT